MIGSQAVRRQIGRGEIGGFENRKPILYYYLYKTEA